MPPPVTLTLERQSGNARAGVLHTLHGDVHTPFFMPVGTLAAVKGLTPAMLRECGAEIVLSNTYHLALRPGEELVRRFGGVAAFMGWHGPTLTDSGGFQVFSLAQINKVTDDGVRFRSHIDGSPLFISPERSLEIQQALGADVMMCFDECPPGESTHDEVARSLRRTHAWAARSKEAWSNREKQALFGIVQGGVYEDLRRESAAAIGELDLPGNAIGGVSVGEAPEKIAEVVAFTAPLLPPDKPRYLMGVGRPQDILRGVGSGVDMFDCVMPTRHARHAEVFTRSGTLKLRNLQYREDARPIEEGCQCYACRTVSRAYLRHLFIAGEILGPVYAAIHNVHFYLQLLRDARAAILEDRYPAFMAAALAGLESGAADA
ncbi:MAG: tRNA guanosine(34) transglycosylase Tgt [Planctomycetes bacterium]|nr:tRNA guanosine(34) transglycosylase Tgt [Planctomycetota bacterium]